MGIDQRILVADYDIIGFLEAIDKEQPLKNICDRFNVKPQEYNLFINVYRNLQDCTDICEIHSWGKFPYIFEYMKNERTSYDNGYLTNVTLDNLKEWKKEAKKNNDSSFVELVTLIIADITEIVEYSDSNIFIVVEIT